MTPVLPVQLLASVKGKINFGVELFGHRGARPVCLKRSKKRKKERSVGLQKLHNILSTLWVIKFQRDQSLLIRGQNFPRTSGISLLPPSFPSSHAPVYQALQMLFPLGIWEHVALEFNACFPKNTTVRSCESGCKAALMSAQRYLLSPLQMKMSSACDELLVASLKHFGEHECVRCAAAHVVGMKGGGETGVSPRGATSSPVLS